MRNFGFSPDKNLHASTWSHERVGPKLKGGLCRLLFKNFGSSRLLVKLLLAAHSSGPHEVLGEIFACVLGYFGPSIHGELPSHVSIRRSGLNHFGAPGRVIRARRRKVLRRDRVSGDEARSPPARSVRFPHPVPMSSRGVRAAAKKVCREIYNDPTRVFLHGTNLVVLIGFAKRRPRRTAPSPRCWLSRPAHQAPSR